MSRHAVSTLILVLSCTLAEACREVGRVLAGMTPAVIALSSRDGSHVSSPVMAVLHAQQHSHHGEQLCVLWGDGERLSSPLLTSLLPALP